MWMLCSKAFPVGSGIGVLFDWCAAGGTVQALATIPELLWEPSLGIYAAVGGSGGILRFSPAARRRSALVLAGSTPADRVGRTFRNCHATVASPGRLSSGEPGFRRSDSDQSRQGPGRRDLRRSAKSISRLAAARSGPWWGRRLRSSASHSLDQRYTASRATVGDSHWPRPASVSTRTCAAAMSSGVRPGCRTFTIIRSARRATALSTWWRRVRSSRRSELSATARASRPRPGCGQ